MKIAQNNNLWFSRHNAFNYLLEDQDNILRVHKIEEYLKSYIHTLSDAHPTLLDIGCGGGQIDKKFIDLGYDVYGTDISRENLIRAKKIGVRVKQSDANRSLPYGSGFFSVVFAGEIIEHLFDTRIFLSEIQRVLRAGGLLILTTPNLAHLPDRCKFLFGISPSQIQPLHMFLRFHIRPFTFQTLRDALKMAKFNVIKQESTMVVLNRNKQNFEKVTLASQALASFVPTLGSFIIMYATKR